jgi:hypothetical protein
MKKTLDLSTVTIEPNILSSLDRVAISWTAPGKRFHLWYNAETDELAEGWLYVNPPEGVAFRDTFNGYFETRRLDAENKTNTPTVKAVLDHVRSEGLIEKAAQAKRQQLEAARARTAEQERIAKIKEAGPVLARALQKILAVAKQQDATMCDPHRDGSATDARSPDGDDWNTLFSLVVPIAESALLAAGVE